MHIGSEQLDLQLTLMDSAQCFHWQRADSGCYIAAVNGFAVRLWQSEDGLHAQSDMSRAQLRHYLDLDRDYALIAAEYAHIPQARRAIELYPGLRVLHQSPWEALIAFILSANNNVARIRKLVNALGYSYGEAYACGDDRVYGFPTPQLLSRCSEAELRALGMGYRAPYIRDAARAVADGFDLNALAHMDYESARNMLLQIPGVGDKVAACILLFGCSHTSAFPVDVWVERLMSSWFDLKGLSRKKLTCLARERLGEHAGLLQQFLFHAARMGDIEL